MHALSSKTKIGCKMLDVLLNSRALWGGGGDRWSVLLCIPKLNEEFTFS